MVESPPDAIERTYPLRTAARLTGLSPDLLRAWERRHGVVRPDRTPGGTRRYSAADVERLRLLKAAVDAGHRIGEVAHLESAELRRRSGLDDVGSVDGLGDVLSALQGLDAERAQRLLSRQLAALGPGRFSRNVALPLVRELGERWARGEQGVAPEHLASGILRSLLGAALQPTVVSMLGPRIVFATPPGERHELGLLMAALTAQGAGADLVYLGAELPVEDILVAVRDANAAALAVGLVALPDLRAARAVRALRDGLPRQVPLWLGGAGARGFETWEGVEQIESLDALEQRVLLLRSADGSRR